MHEKEISYFSEGFRLAGKKHYIDSINQFQSLIEEFPQSDLADDAMFNIGLCYYEMNQFQKSIDIIEKMITIYPDATISVLEDGDEFGKTVAKGYYLIIQCYLGLNNIAKAKLHLKYIKDYDDSYIMRGIEKYTFYALSINAIDSYEKYLKNN